MPLRSVFARCGVRTRYFSCQESLRLVKALRSWKRKYMVAGIWWACGTRGPPCGWPKWSHLLISLTLELYQAQDQMASGLVEVPQSTAGLLEADRAGERGPVLGAVLRKVGSALAAKGVR